MADSAVAARSALPAGRLKQMTFRLAPDLIERLDLFATRLTRRVPGVTYSHSDVVRVLLESGLAEAGLGSPEDHAGERA